jgi:hypothetical protein
MTTPDPENPTLLGAARTGGAALAGVIRGVAAARPGGKPLHPQGEVRRGRLVRHGLASPTGSEWLDEPGEDDVLLRWSRAVGLPAPAPDIHGLAIRVLQPYGEHGDLLFATTGWSRPIRVLLLPGLSRERPMTTLLPYAPPNGAVVLGARPSGAITTLHVASPLGEWREFAELHESDERADDEPIRFDPVLNTLPGLPFPRWVNRLREPSYRTARKSQPQPVTVSRDSSAHREDPR